MKYFIIAFLLIFPVWGQVNQNLFFSEIYIVPSDSVNHVYYLYKIPLNRLVFQKTEDKYKAGYSIALEVTDLKGNFSARQIHDEKVFVNTFDETDNGKIYSEGIIEFKLNKSEHIISPSFTDINLGRERRLQKISVTDVEPSDFLEPIVINAKQNICNNSEVITLANFEGNIPFDDKEYNLLIPIINQISETINLVILNNRDTVFNNEISDYISTDLNFYMCSDKIVLNQPSDQANIRAFMVRGFSSKIREGNLKIIIRENNDQKEKNFSKIVRWYNKPQSLTQPEFAIRSLKYIETESNIKDLLDEDDDIYSEVLFKYWKKFDPTPETSFNQLMEEYYERVDYAARNFSTITGKSGLESDRGKIFIQFGKPQKIERSSNEYGKVMETWIYNKVDRKFIFLDEKGTGDFSLMNG